MSIERFDEAARGFASGASRRWLVRTLGATALGVGTIVGTSRSAEAGVLDGIIGDGDDDKTCRQGCLRRCRRRRQRCVLRTRNPFRCRQNCDALCCEEDEDD